MTYIWKWLSFIFVLGLISIPIAAQDSAPSDFIKAISPDGTQILVESYPSVDIVAADQSMYLMDNGHVSTHLFAGQHVDSAAWSPDGTQIAVTVATASDYIYNLYMVDPKTGETTLASDELYVSGIASWSPDGKWLLLQGPETENANHWFFVWERATGEVTNVMSSYSYYIFSWSPDSQFLMINTIDIGLESPNKIFLYDLREKQLSDNLLQSYFYLQEPHAQASAIWSPNSQQIAVTIGNDANIYFMDVKHHILKPFVYTGAPLNLLNWSPDGTTLYFLLYQPFDPVTGEKIDSASSPLPGVYEASLADGNILPVWWGQVAGYVDFAPDGRHFMVNVFYIGQTRYEYGIGDTDAGTVVPIGPEYPYLYGGYWSLDDQHYTVTLCSEGHDFDIYQIDVVTHNVVNLIQDGDSDAPNCGPMG